MTSSSSIPPELSQVLASALDEVHSHPKHHLRPVRRRQLYDLLARVAPATSPNIRSSLAIISATHVLPIFEHMLPDQPMPRRLLNLAQRVLVDRLAPGSWRVQNYLDMSYHAAGNGWGCDEDDISLSADLAGYAARKALLEVVGYEPLSSLSYLHVFDNGVRLSGEQLTDAHIANGEDGDTASAAAAAYALDVLDPHVAPQRLRTFWEWWLQDACTQAWQQYPE